MVNIRGSQVSLARQVVDYRDLYTRFGGRWVPYGPSWTPSTKASAKVMFDIQQQSNVVNLQDVLVDQTFDTGALEDQMQVYTLNHVD
jgi:type II secretory pathway component PulK